jgi:hypothetical protein
MVNATSIPAAEVTTTRGALSLDALIKLGSITSIPFYSSVINVKIVIMFLSFVGLVSYSISNENIGVVTISSSVLEGLYGF